MQVDTLAPVSRKISNNARFTAFSFCWGDVLLECNENLDILFATGATRALIGCDAGTLPNQNLLSFFDAVNATRVQDAIRTIGANGRLDPLTCQVHGENGRRINAQICGYRVAEFEHHIFLALRHHPQVATLSDAARPMRTPDQLFEADAFTSMAANKIAFDSERDGAAQVSFVKLENLAEIRSSISTAAFDQVISSVAKILRNSSIDGDSAGTMNNGTFGLVHDTSVQVSEIAEKIEGSTRDAIGDGTQLELETSSLNFANSRLSAEEMTKALTYAMKQFSKGGAKLLATSDPELLLRKLTHDTTEIAETFRRICQTRDFNFVFMPIVDLYTSAVHHYEALTRFKHFDDMGLNTFEIITIAEELGMIHEFDLAVTRKAVELISHNILNPKFKPMAINISGASITDKTFMREFTMVLDRANNVSRLLTIEITESAEIQGLSDANSNIQDLRARGFQVALDDFGAGAASFDYLNALDVDMVKFDGPVVRRAIGTVKGRGFLSSIATLCAKTGIKTVAEMVEDEAQAEFLKDCGVQYGQGYYFGKPAADIF